MTPHVVYDTNVIVSAILKPGSIPASLVALAMEGSVRLFLTHEILEEYKDVLKRPTFGFNPSGDTGPPCSIFFALTRAGQLNVRLIAP